MSNLFEQLRGMADCRDGVPHKEGQSEDYDYGYSVQYQAEQILTNRSEEYDRKDSRQRV